MVGSELLKCRSFQKKEEKVAWVAFVHSIRLAWVLLVTYQASSLQPGGTLTRQTPTHGSSWHEACILSKERSNVQAGKKIRKIITHLKKC